MKGIVVEKQNGHAVVLNKNGSFVKVKDKAEYAIGAEYDFRNNLFINKKFASMAAAIALVLGVSPVAYGYVTPTDYVTIDINPSVELVTNRFNKVIRINPLNEDGNKLVDGIKLNNKNLDEAVNLLIKSANEGGYLTQELENQVLVTVCSKNEERSKEMETKLETVVKNELKEEKSESTSVTTQSVDMESHEQAEKLGISSGKMNLIQKLEEVKPGVNYQEYSNKPVKDIMKAINDGKEEKAKGNSNKPEKENINKTPNNEKEPQKGNNSNPEKKNVESAKEKDKVKENGYSNEKKNNNGNNGNKVKKENNGNSSKEKVKGYEKKN
jgi:hypothetical protein